MRILATLVDQRRSHRANRSVAQRGTRSRFPCSLGVSPPPGTYRMMTSNRNNQEPSRIDGLCKLNLTNKGGVISDPKARAH